jgi:hypothetical protein
MLYLARAVHQHDAVMRGEHALLDQFTAAPSSDGGATIRRPMNSLWPR